jgi:hypothetical protein
MDEADAIDRFLSGPEVQLAEKAADSDLDSFTLLQSPAVGSVQSERVREGI